MRPNSNEADDNSRTFGQENSQPRVRIIKVGGSLFTFADLKNRLLRFADTIQSPDSVNVWIPGGGPMVDDIRNWQRQHGLDEETAHRVSLQTLALTATLFCDLMQRWPLEKSLPDLKHRTHRSTGDIIFDSSDWANRCQNLPRSWATTSDSIALQLGGEIEAEQLILLKSVSPVSETISSQQQAGIIDSHFGTGFKFKCRPEVAIVNLRKSFEISKLAW